MSPPSRVIDEEDAAACVPRVVPTACARSAVRPVVRRGLSRVEAATYLGISTSKFDELRKANRIAPPKILDGRLIFTIERLDEFLDALPDENHDAAEDWTVAV